VERTEVDKSKHLETWFVDCKHYKKGVPPENLQGLLAWAEAERPDVALVIASGALSNGSKDYIKDYEINRKPPFRIKYWERPTLERLAAGRDHLLNSYLLAEGLRTVNEIVAAEQEFFDKLWFFFHVELRDEVAGGKEIDPVIWEEAKRRAEEVVQRYGGEEAMLPKNDYELGMMDGKLSALRWVLGSEWDFLDL
jgi:integrase